MNAKEGKQPQKTRGRRARKSKRNDDDDGGNANASRESNFAAAAPEYSSLLNNNKSNELVVPPASNERNIAHVPLRVEHSSVAVGASNTSANAKNLLASVAGEKVFPTEGGIQGRAYDVACEAVAFATFMDDDDNNAVERAMRKMKRLRLACNGNGEDVIEWKKHERCARLALGRCVEWMEKEYAGKEERKVVRLGVRAVRVLAKYADAGEYSKFDGNEYDRNINSSRSSRGGEGNKSGANKNPKKLKGLSRMVSKAALRAGLRKSKKQQQQQQQQQQQKFSHDVVSDDDNGNYKDEEPEMLMEKKSMKQRTVGASESNIANENKLVKVTMTLYDESNAKILKFVSTKATQLTYPLSPFDAQDGMKEAIFNAVTPSFVANKIHLIEIEVVDVTSTGNQVSANEALISTDDGEEKDELERKVFDPERFSSSFGVADSNAVGMIETNMVRASIIPRRNYPILGRVCLPIGSIGDTSLKSASRDLTLALEAIDGVTATATIGTVDASVDSFISYEKKSKNSDRTGTFSKKGHAIIPTNGELDILQYAKIGIATLRFFTHLDRGESYRVFIYEVLQDIARTHCKEKDVAPRSGVAVCEAYALFEKWCPEKMLYTDSDNRRKRIGGVGNNDMRTAEVFRDALANVAAAIAAERHGELEKVYFTKLAKETRDMCVRTLEMYGFDDMHYDDDDAQSIHANGIENVESDMELASREKKTMLIMETLAIVSEPLGEISKNNLFSLRFSKIARQCGTNLFRNRLNANVSDAIGRITLSGTLKMIGSLIGHSKSDARKLRERFPSEANPVYFAFEASLSRTLTLVASTLTACGEKGLNPKYEENVVKSIDTELFRLAKAYEEEIPPNSGFSFLSRRSDFLTASASTMPCYYSESVKSAYRNYERALHPAIQESVEYATEELKRFVSTHCIGSPSDFPKPIPMNHNTGDMHSAASEDVLRACEEIYEALTFSMQPKYRRRFHVEKIALAIKESLVEYSEAQKLYATVLIKRARRSEVERLSRDEDLSVGISSVFEDGSFYGRISNANKCFEGFINLMEEYPRCWKKIAKEKDDETDENAAENDQEESISSVNTQIQYVASSAYKKLKSNRDEMLHALAELFSQRISRDLKVAIFDTYDDSRKFATMRCLNMVEAEIIRADTSLSLGCSKVFLKALHAGILDAIERIVLGSRLDPFSKADLTRGDSGKFSDGNHAFFDASTTRITEVTHSRCVQFCDDVSEFFKAEYKKMNGSDGSARTLRDLQKSERRTRRILDLWYTPTMEVAKLVPEEEETRERVSSMDVLRILKQRGDKDKWARDVVRGGAQNLAHSLCARVIKTFNAKLKHEGEKALLGCWPCRSDFGLRGCVFVTSTAIGFTTFCFGIRFESAENAHEQQHQREWVCEVDRMCALLRIESEDGTPGVHIQLDDRSSLYLSEFGDEEISYSTEKRAIERDMFVTTLRTHDKFAPRGGKRREKIKDTGNDESKSEVSYQSSIAPAPPREFNILPNSDPQLKVFEDVYKNETNGFKVHGQICVNRYTVQFLPSDETITGVTIFLRNISPTFVRKRKVGWTNAEVWISEGFIFSGLDLNVAGELAKMIKVGIAMVT